MDALQVNKYATDAEKNPIFQRISMVLPTWASNTVAIMEHLSLSWNRQQMNARESEMSWSSALYGILFVLCLWWHLICRCLVIIWSELRDVDDAKTNVLNAVAFSPRRMSYGYF